MYVIYEEINNTFKAVSKGWLNGIEKIEENEVKKIVIRMEGTDILLYDIKRYVIS